MQTISSIKVGQQVRSVPIQRGMIDEEKRTVRVQFSSENPVNRWYGIEVLDHSPGSVRMDRLNSGVAVLLEHDVNQRVGITESASITGSRTGEAVVRFAKTPRGEEAWNEVRDGTLKYLSVGYNVHRFQAEGEMEDEDDPVTYRAVDWEPLEITFTAIPADPSARVLRTGSTDETVATVEDKRKMKSKVLLDASSQTTTGGGGGAAPVVIESPNTDQQRAEERQRVRDILALGKRFGLDAEADKAVDEGMSLSDFRGLVLAKQNPGAKTIITETPQHDHRSPGQIFVDCPELKAIRGKKLQRGGTVGIDIPHMLSLHQRATVTSSSGAVLTNYERPPGIVMLEQQPVTIADLLLSGTTSAPTVRYTRENSYTQAATAVAEAGQKPEATFDFVESSVDVKKIAVYAKISDEVVNDFPQIQSTVDQRLRYMVAALEDNHLLNGTGSSNQITGILNTPGIQTVSAAAYASVADAIFQAMGKVRNIGFFEPTFVVMNSNDWTNLLLAKDSNNQYLFGGPAYGPYGVGGFTNARFIWGVPCIGTSVMAAGTALVGSRIGAQVWRREGIRLELTNSNEDDFEKNLITIRCEERLALTVYRPLAFCTVTAIPS